MKQYGSIILKVTYRDGRQISLIAEYSQIDADKLKTQGKHFTLQTGIGINHIKCVAKKQQANVALFLNQPLWGGQSKTHNL